MTIALPITNFAISEHSHTTAAAISSGVPILPTGSSEITFARPWAVPPVKRLFHFRARGDGHSGIP
jgi:hypothetical protein